MDESWQIITLGLLLMAIHLGGLVAAVVFGLKRRRTWIAWQDVVVLVLPTLLTLAVGHAIGYINYREQLDYVMSRRHTFVEVRPSGDEYWVGPVGSTLIKPWNIANIPSPGPIDFIVVPTAIAMWSIARIRSRSKPSTPAQ